MITLSADNRSLLLGAPYTYLQDNNTSGQSSLGVINTNDLSPGSFVLVGLFGNPTSEIFQVGVVSTENQSFALLDMTGLPTSTAFSHNESTRITVMPFNQIAFYWTPSTGTIADETPVFDLNTPLSGWLPIDPTAWFTSYDDSSKLSGFGWFLFRNSNTLEASQPSNAIPYGGFATNTVQYIFNDFMSLLNNRELKLVTNMDMFSWLNEGNNLMRNKLNLTNPEYTASTPQTVLFLEGVSEYLLPPDFGDLVQIIDNTSDKHAIEWISIKDAMEYKGGRLRYYIRGRYIGFVPIPGTPFASSTTGFIYTYRSKGYRFTGLDDAIDLPDNGFYALKDWMMYRACLKFQNPNAQVYYKGFNDGLNQMIVSSLHRDANLDTWGIAPNANA